MLATLSAGLRARVVAALEEGLFCSQAAARFGAVRRERGQLQPLARKGAADRLAVPSTDGRRSAFRPLGAGRKQGEFPLAGEPTPVHALLGIQVGACTSATARATPWDIPV